MTPDGYQVWYDFIVTHAVKGDSRVTIGPDGQIVFTPEQSDQAEEQPDTGEQAQETGQPGWQRPGFPDERITTAVDVRG